MHYRKPELPWEKQLVKQKAPPVKQIKHDGINLVVFRILCINLFLNKYFNLNTYKSDWIINAFEAVFSKYYHKTQDVLCLTWSKSNLKFLLS